jgi:hypothetical protein
MESRPSRIIEVLTGWLIPCACRQEVLGDMRERYLGLGRYLLEASHVIPCVIYSRIRRTTDPVVTLMEAVSLYTAFLMAAWWLDRRVLLDHRGALRLAVAPSIFLLAAIIGDAYSNPKRLWYLKPLIAPSAGFALAWIAQYLFTQWALPVAVFAWGSSMSWILVSTLRLMYSPTGRPQAARMPAHWQKQQIAPLPSGFKAALAPCVFLLIVIFYLLAR